MKKLTAPRTHLLTGGALALLIGLAGCNGNSSDSATVAVAGDVPIAYAKRATSMSINPTDGAPTAPGGDLMIREKSSASAPEHNVTALFTQGVGDVSDPEVSYDGKKIVFAMRCPTANTAKIGDLPACTGRWNIWEYDMTSGGFAGGSFKRLTNTSESDDVDPAYLPAGRGYVFSSNRQTSTRNAQALGQSYFALDEYERERVLNLHTMNADGGAITQISVNQSHDRNPVVRPDGTIMFSRWEHVGPRNRFAIFRVKPDGTDMFVLYGAHSPGNSFLHPRDMDPNGPYKGFVASSLMSLSRTQEGGALMFIDAANYSEQNTPATPKVAADGGQKEVTAQTLNQGRGLSPFGRVTTPYPLWDGTNRVLVSFRPCEVTRDGKVVPCATLSADELARLGENRTDAEVAADSVKDDAPAAYAVYMYDPDKNKQTWLIVAAPPPGFMYTDPVPLQARAEPSTAESSTVDPDLASQGLALIEVRSVYDTDGLDRMGESFLSAADLPAGCTAGIAKTKPSDPLDTRGQVADLVRIKDPADAAYGCAPARFVRAIRAVAPPGNAMGLRSAIGETEFEQQQILGYAPVEPDGSFRLLVPADVPLALAIIDAKGRGIQTHLNWIQVRPGERRTCDGCHSPRRGGATNSGAVVNTMPAALKQSLASQHQSGETMAALRTRLDPTLLRLMNDMVYDDVWADTTKPGVAARSTIALRYKGNTNPADDLTTPAPVDGIVNYPQHVAPLWTKSRGAAGVNTCTNCHADSAKLDLRATVSGTGRVVSYEELVLGDPLLDASGKPQIRIEDGVPEIIRGAALVETMAGNAGGMARNSRLIEILFGENLKADGDARTLHPNPPVGTVNHATLLNAAEKRVVTEWIDLGGQYYNNPFDGGVKTVVTLSEASFTSQVMPTLKASCAGCHQAGGNSGAASGPTSFRGNRFVLTGSPEGDFGVTLSMISDTCNPSTNFLLKKPSTVPHPAAATTQIAAVLPVGSAGYTAISNWISSGCPRP